jgi:SAM-dependent methyltransferase
VADDDTFLSDLSVGLYLRGDVFRHHQDAFLARHGRGRRGVVVELGGERAYDLGRHFPDADRYVVTNLDGDPDVRLDLTRLGLADGSVETAVCVSVLEHVDDLTTAVAELRRVVAPGGRLLLTVPFLYPLHDRHDVWRVAPDAWPALLGDEFEVEVVTRLGGRLATLAMLLQRPRGVWNLRYAPQKLVGLVLVALLGRRDQPDDAPMGSGVVARRR